MADLHSMDNLKISGTGLGPLSQFNLETAPLTIICGPNNSGKTYLTHALWYVYHYLLRGGLGYSFLKNTPFDDAAVFTEAEPPLVFRFRLDNLMSWLTGQIEIFNESLPEKLRRALMLGEGTSAELKFALELDTSPELLTKRVREILDRAAHFPVSGFVVDVGSGAGDVVELRLDELHVDGEEYEHFCRLLRLSRENQIDLNIVTELVDHPICNHIAVFSSWLFTNAILGDVSSAHIVTSERTGMAFFHDAFFGAYLNALDDDVPTATVPSMGGINQLQELVRDYPLAFRNNLSHLLRVVNRSQRQHAFRSDDERPQGDADSAQLTAIIELMDDLLEGEVRVGDTGISYTPKVEAEAARFSLAMPTSSSTVRSLMELRSILGLSVRVNTALFIDEPELNLHPAKQVKLARLMAMLVNYGVRVFLTTHSDYFVREIGLAMLYHGKQCRSNGIFPDSEVEAALGASSHFSLAPENVAVFYTVPADRRGSYLLERAEFSPEYGIDMSFFDDVILDQNRRLDIACCELGDDFADVHSMEG